MKQLALFAVLLFAISCAAQDKQKAAPAAPAAPTAAPSVPTPNFCDQSFSSVTETWDHRLVSIVPPIVLYAVPWVDVADNHAKQLNVLNALNREAGPPGEDRPYVVTVSETQTCDGGPTVRITSGSAFVEGVSLDGAVRVADVSIQMAQQINDRYRSRAKQGAKQGWNHKNADNVQRDDAGNVIPPGQMKKK